MAHNYVWMYSVSMAFKLPMKWQAITVCMNVFSVHGIQTANEMSGNYGMYECIQCPWHSSCQWNGRQLRYVWMYSVSMAFKLPMKCQAITVCMNVFSVHGIQAANEMAGNYGMYECIQCPWHSNCQWNGRQLRYVWMYSVFMAFKLPMKWQAITVCMNVFSVQRIQAANEMAGNYGMYECIQCPWHSSCQWNGRQLRYVWMYSVFMAFKLPMKYKAIMSVRSYKNK